MKIRGNTVGTTMPRPDWNQTDPKKADYIANKPDLESMNNTFIGDANTTAAEYKEAWSAGKMGFRRTTGPNSSAWVVCGYNPGGVFFYGYNTAKNVVFGYLSNDGAWNDTQVKTVKTVNGVTPDLDGNVNVTLTDDQIDQIVDRVMETMPTWTGGSY